MKTRVIAAAVIIPVALVILLVLPPYILTITVSLISAVAAYELLKAVNHSFYRGDHWSSAGEHSSPLHKSTPSRTKTDDSDNIKYRTSWINKLFSKEPDNSDTPPSRVAVYAIISASLIPFIVFLNNLLGIRLFIGELAVLFILVSLLLIDFFLTLKSKKRLRLRQILMTPIAALLIPYMLSSLISLRLLPAGQLIILLPVIITVISDSGAYFTGKAVGKRHPFPSVSPNKTVAGCVGAVLSGVAGLLVYGGILSIATELTVSFPFFIVYGLLGSIITIAGDLAFSLVKRKCGIKDYGSLIPGHGGVLDRFDSLIFTAPAIYLLMLVLPAVR